MGEDGFKGYLHKGRYYRNYLHGGELESDGDEIVSKIPQDSEIREAWIMSMRKLIDEEVEWRREHKIPDIVSLNCDWEHSFDDDENNCLGELIVLQDFGDRPLHFMDILDNTVGEMPTDGETWTYVVDFDNLAFTINGRMHFRLDNMPSGSIAKHLFRAPHPEYEEDDEEVEEVCAPTLAHLPSTPIEHIATVARWPLSTSDATKAHKRYKKLNTVTLELKEWSVPDWTKLSVAQELSAELVRTVLRDNAETMSNPDCRYVRRAFLECCWKVINAAAPNNLYCPVDAAPEDEEKGKFVWPLSQEYRVYTGNAWLMPHHYHDSKGFSARNLVKRYYLSFRGCLVLFCPRLDAPEHIQRETVNLVDRLRTRRHTPSVGLAFCGRYVMAVALDDDDIVRCSNPVPFHDAKMQLLDGFLLMTHLIAPLLSVNKTPWQTVADQPIVSTPNLPMELLQRIVYQLDDDSYYQLPLVSRAFRTIYMDHPRVLGCHLISYLGAGDYQVMPTTNQTAQTLHLQRQHHFTDYYELLENSFQYTSRAPHDLRAGEFMDGIIDTARSEPTVRMPDKLWYPLASGFRPEIRMQIIHGIWDFVSPEDAESNFPKSLEYNQEQWISVLRDAERW